MGPPASGATRKSHTKSRDGCNTCKRRHIKCDQVRPQCGNCVKHNVLCPYLDKIPKGDTPPLGNPDLGLTAQIEQDLKNWKEDGVYPFPSLQVLEKPSLAQYNSTDLRLMYHVSAISAQMQNVESQEHSVWVQRVPLFLKLASKYDFVMHALLALAASHLSWLTGCQATLQLSYQHQVEALQKLPLAVGQFSRENADAVLAASILLAWQATDWFDWAKLMRGTATVVEHMQQWKQKSEFLEYLEESAAFLQASPRMFGLEEDQKWLNYVYISLTRLEPYVRGRVEETNGLHDLMDFVRNLFHHLPMRSEEEQFELLHPLRMWLMFLPISFARRVNSDPDVMILLAHFYGVALAIEPLFPAVGAAYFGSMSLGPIKEIHKDLFRRDQAKLMDSKWPIELMEFPLQMARDFRIRMRWIREDEVPLIGLNEIDNPPSPSGESGFASSSSRSSDATSGPHIFVHNGRDSGFDMGQFADMQINPLMDEEFYCGSSHGGARGTGTEPRMLWRGLQEGGN